jgi:RNA polymerase sigma-70 factor (ECF subfamily)
MAIGHETGGLGQHLLATVAARRGGTAPAADAAAVEQAVTRLLAAARAAWPQLELDDRAFVDFVAARLPDDSSVEDALAALHGTDLYLALGLIQGHRAALAIFEKELAPVIDVSLRRMRLPDAVIDEMKQSLREQLLVAPPGKDRPMIGNYAGKGQLRSWLRITAVRTTTKWLDRANHEVPVEEEALDRAVGAAGAVSGGPPSGAASDAELERLKAAYDKEFRAAFHQALASLGGQERTVLLQHYIDGLSIDRLGALYRVHRATAARWVSRAREALLERTREALTRALQLSPPDFESVMRLIDSRLGFTLKSFISRDLLRDD